MAPFRSVLSHHIVWKAALPRLWVWLTDTGYKPERHYMRGGRSPAAEPHP
jgi:hypothetical protein